MSNFCFNNIFLEILWWYYFQFEQYLFPVSSLYYIHSVWHSDNKYIVAYFKGWTNLQTFPAVIHEGFCEINQKTPDWLLKGYLSLDLGYIP